MQRVLTGGNVPVLEEENINLKYLKQHQSFARIKMSKVVQSIFLRTFASRFNEFLNPLTPVAVVLDVKALRPINRLAACLEFMKS